MPYSQTLTGEYLRARENAKQTGALDGSLTDHLLEHLANIEQTVACGWNHQALAKLAAFKREIETSREILDTDSNRDLVTALDHLTFCRDHAALELAYASLSADHGDHEAGQRISGLQTSLGTWQVQVDELTDATIANLDPGRR